MSSQENILETFQVLKTLKKMDLFKDISTEDLFFIASRMQVLKFFPGEYLFHKGNPGDGLYVIREGLVEVSLNNKFLRTMGRDEFLGEMSLIDGAPRSADAKCLKEGKFLFLSKENFTPFLKIHPSIFFHLLKILASRLKDWAP